MAIACGAAELALNPTAALRGGSELPIPLPTLSSRIHPHALVIYGISVKTSTILNAKAREITLQIVEFGWG
tara:strand:- start:229 stop:441 length:213 start_codon:yes stop_codon:yes gene_type:complete